MKFYQKILIGLVLGFVAGIVLGERAAHVKPVGDVFIRCLRLIVLPLILATLVSGVSSAGDIRKVGRMEIRTFLYFVATTTVAVTIGLFVSNLIEPGAGISLRQAQAFAG